MVEHIRPMITSKVMIRVMVRADSMSTGNTQASRRNRVSVAAAYWWTPVFGDPVVTITPGGDVNGLDGNRNMSVLIPNRPPPPPVICTTLAAASMSSLPGHHTCWTKNAPVREGKKKNERSIETERTICRCLTIVTTIVEVENILRTYSFCLTRTSI